MVCVLVCVLGSVVDVPPKFKARNPPTTMMTTTITTIAMLATLLIPEFRLKRFMVKSISYLTIKELSDYLQKKIHRTHINY